MSVFMSVAAGTYATSLVVFNLPNSELVTINGDTATPANVQLTLSSGAYISFAHGSDGVIFQGFTVTGPTNVNCVVCASTFCYFLHIVTSGCINGFFLQSPYSILQSVTASGYSSAGITSYWGLVQLISVTITGPGSTLAGVIVDQGTIVMTDSASRISNVQYGFVCSSFGSFVDQFQATIFTSVTTPFSGCPHN